MSLSLQKNLQRGLLIGVPILLFVPTSLAKKHADHAAHVHGVVSLDLALESGNQGYLELKAPGESVLGFEHEARSSDEKKTEEQVRSKLKSKAADYFVFESDRGCSLVAEELLIKAQDHRHTELHARFRLQCKKDLTGSLLTINLGRDFPRIEKLDFQLLSDSKQQASKIKGGKGSVKL